MGSSVFEERGRGTTTPPVGWGAGALADGAADAVTIGVKLGAAVVRTGGTYVGAAVVAAVADSMFGADGCGSRRVLVHAK